jgi:hypothetical protein
MMILMLLIGGMVVTWLASLDWNINKVGGQGK